MTDTDLQDDDAGPSKSQRKRDMTALQELGARLTALTPAALKLCALPENLLDAIHEFQVLPNSHGARKRQLQFIGKVMRDLDELDLARISAQLNRDASVEKHRYKALEALRTALLAGSKESLEQLTREQPTVDLVQITALIKQAQTEKERASTPLASRQLFQLLRRLYGI